MVGYLEHMHAYNLFGRGDKKTKYIIIQLICEELLHNDYINMYMS